MEDQAIIDLYWAREEQALTETDRKYGGYCRSIACNILKDPGDTEECVNDTYWKAWNAMPPKRPTILPVFLGTITRNLALNRIEAGRSRKRGGGQLTLALEELDGCIPARENVEQTVEAAELGQTLDRFLRSLPDRDRCIFVRRYWYMDALRDIARRHHMTEGGVKSNLFRTRKKLRTLLEQEGLWI